MKQFIILIIVVAALNSSCTKTKTNTITVTKNDTTVIVKMIDSLLITNSSLIGQWVGTDTVTLDGNYFAQSHNGQFKYVTSPDTIYWYHNDLSANGYYGYKISADNDTLTLYPTFTPLIYTYHRLN